MKMREHLQRNLFNSVHIQHKHFHFYVFLSQTVELVALRLDACFGEALPVCVCPRMLLLDVKDSLQDRAWVLKRSNL